MHTIAFIEGHKLFREGFALLAAQRPDVHLVGDADNLGAALQLVAEHGPEVAIVDPLLPGAVRLGAVRALAIHPRAPRVLALSTSGRIDAAAEALAAGAHGFALRSQSSDDLFGAVHALAAGGDYLPPSLSREEVEAARGALETQAPAPDVLGRLSPREREVFLLLVHGESNARIGARLGITVRTAETHRAHVLRKLERHCLGDLVRLAVDQGLVGAP